MIISYIYNRKEIARTYNSKQVPNIGDEVLLSSENFHHIISETKLFIVKNRRFIPHDKQDESVWCIILEDTFREMDILDIEEEEGNIRFGNNGEVL